MEASRDDAIRQRVHRTKESSSRLTEIFKGKQAKELKQEGKKISSAVRELEEDKRIIGTVRASLHLIPEALMAELEKRYPHTAHNLFKLSQHLIEGKYGNALKWLAQAQSDQLLNESSMLCLMMIDFYRGGEDRPFPEILEGIQHANAYTHLQKSIQELSDPQLKNVMKEGDLFLQMNKLVGQMDLSSLERETLLGLFRKFLNNLSSPSHVSVGMILEREHSVDKTIRAVQSIKSSSERSKSMVNVVDRLFKAHRVDKAIEFVASIQSKSEIAKPLTSLVNRLLSPKRKDIEAMIQADQIDEAVNMAKTLGKGQKDQVLQRIVSGLAKHDLIEKALNVADSIENRETKDFALSTMVSSLASQGDYEGAIKVAAVIEDLELKEDAYSYIVRGLIEGKHFKEVVAFVETIKDPRLRVRAAKLILSSVVANRDLGKAEEVRRRFELSR